MTTKKKKKTEKIVKEPFVPPPKGTVPPQQKGNIDDVLDKIDLNEKTEMEGVADQIFRSTPTRSNITPDEAAACFKCNAIFPTMGMDDENPVNGFLELKKSQSGWSTEKFVQATGGINEQRKGLMGTIGDKLFKSNNTQ